LFYEFFKSAIAPITAVVLKRPKEMDPETYAVYVLDTVIGEEVNRGKCIT